MKLDANTSNVQTCIAAKIYLNGVLHEKLVVRCDDQAGTADLYWKTITGKYAVVGFGGNQRFATRQFKGDVVIEIPAGVEGGPYRTPTKELTK